MRLKVIVSNGSFRFHLSVLAAELDKRNILTSFFTAGYPTKFILFFIKIGKNKASYKRFLDRAADNINLRKVSADNFSEIFMRLGAVVLRKFSVRLEQKVSILGMQLYSLNAAIKLLFLKADVYHYRNCYGGVSVKIAQWKGIKTICDHSIGHPYLIDYMIVQKGIYPPANEVFKIRQSIMPLYKRMNNDFKHNDLILVNSEFVKETMIFCGVEESRIKVVYLGVDDNFLQNIPFFLPNEGLSNNRILFAGGLQKRKGILDLLTVLSNFKMVDIDLAGGIDFEISENKQFKDIIALENVNYLGILPRNELSKLMSSHRIFIFYSYCEGSARVIFEAMAAGLFIITTKNSGSIVQHMENGIIVKTGDATALQNALNWVFNDNNRVEIDRIRKNNFVVIRNKYTQKNYGNNILNLYSELVSQ